MSDHLPSDQVLVSSWKYDQHSMFWTPASYHENKKKCPMNRTVWSIHVCIHTVGYTDNISSSTLLIDQVNQSNESILHILVQHYSSEFISLIMLKLITKAYLKFKNSIFKIRRLSKSIASSLHFKVQKPLSKASF